MMDKFDEYQQKAMEFAVFQDPLYPLFALVEEVGEMSKVYAKAARGDKSYSCPTARRTAIINEAGDILWQLTALLEVNDMKLKDIAYSNIFKLEDRKERGKIKGDGDYR